MTEANQKQLGKVLWSIADDLRGQMDADDFRDYMLALLFLRYLSDNYEEAAKNDLPPVFIPPVGTVVDPLDPVAAERRQDQAG